MKIQKLSPTCSIEPLEARIAPATIINPSTVVWTDTDGDAVTLQVSKALFAKTKTLTKAEVLSKVLIFNQSSGNQQLLAIDLTGFRAVAADMDITLTATTPTGGTGDGKVNVGFIKAAIPDPDAFAINKGVDLGNITIAGDLGGIYAGDQMADTAVKSIKVQSWGKLNSVEQNAQTAGTIPTDLHSIVLGPISKITIGTKGVGGGNFDGTYGARLQVLGGVYGKIGALAINGSVIGGAAAESGQIFVSKSIGNVRIDGSLIGGAGGNSGTLYGSTSSQTSFGNIEIGGNLQGGAGTFSGSIVTSGAVGSLTITKDILGGAGNRSGTVNAGSIAQLEIGHSITGGSSNSSGGLNIVGKLGQATIGDNTPGAGIVGGTSSQNATTTTIASGFILAGSIKNMVLDGDLVAGTVTGNASLIYSGAIIATKQINKLTINGDVTGNAGAAALIAAQGALTGKTSIAINTLKIIGSVDHANILAGYAPDLRATATTASLTGFNADAQIGTITIGNISATNIVAGASAGPDGKFGTADDARISGTGTSNRAGIVSSIASIIVTGQATTGTSGSGYGIVADQLGAIKIGTTAVALNAGPNNDLTSIVITGTTDFQAIEITPPIAS